MSDMNGSQAVKNVLSDAKAAGEAAQQVGQQAKQAGSDAVADAMDVAQDAKTRAGSIASVVGEKASSVADAQKSGLADKLEDISNAVHRSGEQLEGHQDFVAQIVERGAEELGRLATTLRSNDLQTLLGELGSRFCSYPGRASCSFAPGAPVSIGYASSSGQSESEVLV
jgi:F0F1-type ATP synthase membrane subunit b/b'